MMKVTQQNDMERTELVTSSVESEDSPTLSPRTLFQIEMLPGLQCLFVTGGLLGPLEILCEISGVSRQQLFQLVAFSLLLDPVGCVVPEDIPWRYGDASSSFKCLECS